MGIPFVYAPCVHLKMGSGVHIRMLHRYLAGFTDDFPLGCDLFN